MIIIYARIHYIYPDKDLFDIIEICFGKFIGKVLILLYVWFIYFFISDIFVTYGQFITTIRLQETPQTIPIIFLGILCAWGIRGGIEVLGRGGAFFLGVVVIFLLIMTTLLIPQMNINNMRPVLSEGMKPVFKGAFSVFTFPLVQTVVFTMAFSNFKKNQSPYKIYMVGVLVGGLYLAILSITNVLVIGVDTATTVYYPVYFAASRIDVGNIVQRVEIIGATTFVVGGFMKISILLLCICKGITKLFGFDDYRFIITPVLLLIINLSYFQYESIMHYFEFNTEIWPYYHFPFQVIFPIIILITAEIKRKRMYVK